MSAESPFIIPVFIPHHGCPHQCVFCNQTAITGVSSDFDGSDAITGAVSSTIGPETVSGRIREFLRYKKNTGKRAQIAFYGGNFLGLEQDTIRMLLDEAARFIKKGVVDSIRFSTRPDTIHAAALDLIEAFPVSTIELGVQSMNDRALSHSNRGHSARDTERAVSLLKERGYEVGLQMMVGLPGDSSKACLMTAEKIARLSPEFVRIYPTLVLAGSPLARQYERGDYAPLLLDACVALVAEIYRIFSSSGITVARMGLQESEELSDDAVVIAGPHHPAFGHLVYSKLFLDMAADRLGRLAEEKRAGQAVTIRVHPRSISRMRGLKNSNMRALKRLFGIRQLDVVPDKTVGEEALSVEAGRC